MKKIVKSLFIAALAFAVVACNKAVPEKAVVEAGFANKAPVPTASIDASFFETNGVTATFKVTFSGISAEAMDSLSVGLLYSDEPTFLNSTFKAVETDKDGVYEVVINTKDNSIGYFRAVVANTGGTYLSDIVEKKLPEAPFYLKVLGTYKGKVVSEASGDEYGSELVILPVEGSTTKCIISGIEPQLAKKGLVYPKGNYCEADLDAESGIISISFGAPMNFQEFLVFGSSTKSLGDDTKFGPALFKLNEDGNLYREFGYGRMSGGQLNDYFTGDVTYVKQ